MLTKQDLSQIKNILQVELKPINKKLNKLQADLDGTIDFFDDIRVKHCKQINRIETHLGLPPIPVLSVSM